MEILGEGKIQLMIGKKPFNITVLVIQSVQADLLLSFSFLLENEMEIARKDQGDFLKLKKADVEVPLQAFEPDDRDRKMLTIRTKTGAEAKRSSGPGRWTWNHSAAQKLEGVGEAIMVSPQTEILSGVELIEKAKFYRATGKRGYAVVPCDIRESGTAEILDIAKEIPLHIPASFIEREKIGRASCRERV